MGLEVSKNVVSALECLPPRPGLAVVATATGKGTELVEWWRDIYCASGATLLLKFARFLVHT